MCTVGERGQCVLERLQAEDVFAMPAETIGPDLEELRRHVNSCEAEFQRRLHRFDKGDGYAADGAFTTRAWLRWKCHVAASTASDMVEVARKLPDLEVTQAALTSGEISYRHASLIVRTAKRLGEKFEGDAESILVTAARELDPAQLRVAILHLRHCLEPDGVLEDANRAFDNRFLHLSQTLDGIFRIDGQLDPEGGATLRTALDALMRPPAHDDERTATQRRADALVELARNQLDSGELPEVGGQKPHLVVTVDMATLSKEPGSRAAELEWSEPIPAETARRIACDCSLTPVMCGPDGQVVGAGSTTRVIPPHVRRALLARDKGCRVLGCDMPAAWTDAHHIKHWADGGPHELWNLILLCRRHHRRMHEGGWRLVRAGDDLLQAVPP